MIGKDTLPLVTIKTAVVNPEWSPIFEDGNPRAVNEASYRITVELEAEVLQLNLSTGGMRVRYRRPDRDGKMKTITEDVSASFFFNQYTITENS